MNHGTQFIRQSRREMTTQSRNKWRTRSARRNFLKMPRAAEAESQNNKTEKSSSEQPKLKRVKAWMTECQKCNQPSRVATKSHMWGKGHSEKKPEGKNKIQSKTWQQQRLSKTWRTMKWLQKSSGQRRQQDDGQTTKVAGKHPKGKWTSRPKATQVEKQWNSMRRHTNGKKTCQDTVSNARTKMTKSQRSASNDQVGQQKSQQHEDTTHNKMYQVIEHERQYEQRMINHRSQPKKKTRPSEWSESQAKNLDSNKNKTCTNGQKQSKDD